MFVVFLHGPPASGKYTVGGALAKLLDVPLFHNHLTVDLARCLFEFGSPGFVSLREHVWLAAFDAAGAAGQSFIFTFAPEASVDAGLIGRLQERIARHRGTIYFVELRCPEAILEARLAAPARGAFGKLCSVELYRSIKDAGGFAFPALPAALAVIDSAALSPEQAALAVQQALPKIGFCVQQ